MEGWGRLYTGYSLLTNQLSIGWTLFKLATWRCLPKVSISKRELNPDPRPYSVLFAIQDGVFGRVACSLDKYKALTPPPQSLPLFPPLPYWTLLHLGPPLLVLSSLRAWSIDQFFVQKQKLKIDRNIQFLILFLNSRHSSWQMTAETVFPRIAKISMVRQPF